jgi:hypothetical protein
VEVQFIYYYHDINKPMKVKIRKLPDTLILLANIYILSDMKKTKQKKKKNSLN